MGEFEIKNYIVETVHTGKDPEILYQRFIILEGTAISGSTQQAVFIFMEDERLLPNGAGFFTSTAVLYCVLRIRDFRDVYDILRNERPVFCSFSSDSGSPAIVQITTGKEPVGEGPMDRSRPTITIADIISELSEILPSG